MAENFPRMGEPENCDVGNSYRRGFGKADKRKEAN